MVGATLLSLAGAVEQVFLIMVVPAAVALLADLTLRKTGTISHAV